MAAIVPLHPSHKNTFVLELNLPQELQHSEGEGVSRRLSREDWMELVVQSFGNRGLLGIHEATVLTDQAESEGLETDSWVVDSAQAPRERDWASELKEIPVEIYFESESQARSAQNWIQLATGLKGRIKELIHQDWNEEWKKQFQGISVPPYWEVLPPWKANDAVFPGKKALILNPGAGFGTGTHETTQLCMGAVADYFSRVKIPEPRVLDFGSGSGVLSIAAAKLGGSVVAVEIDDLAIENAHENAKLNGVENRIAFFQTLEASDEAIPIQSYDLVIANILKPVLIEFSKPLTERMKSGGTLILSGLIEKDIEDVKKAFSSHLKTAQFQQKSLGEWRALVWSS